MPILIGQDVGVGGDDRTLVVRDRVGDGGDQGRQRLSETSRSFKKPCSTLFDEIAQEQRQLNLMLPGLKTRALGEAIKRLLHQFLSGHAVPSASVVSIGADMIMVLKGDYIED